MTRKTLEISKARAIGPFLLLLSGSAMPHHKEHRCDLCTALVVALLLLICVIGLLWVDIGRLKRALAPDHRTSLVGIRAGHDRDKAALWVGFVAVFHGKAISSFRLIPLRTMYLGLLPSGR